MIKISIQDRINSIVTYRDYLRACKRLNVVTATMHKEKINVADYTTHFLACVDDPESVRAKYAPVEQHVHPANVSWAFRLSDEEINVKCESHWVDYLVEVAEEYESAFTSNFPINEEYIEISISVISHIFNMFKKQLGASKECQQKEL